MTGAGTAGASRHLARMILAEGRFHQPSVPRPLHGVLRAIGDGLSAPVDLLNKAVDAVGKLLPGGAAIVWVVLGVALAGFVAWVGARRARRRLTAEQASGPPAAARRERVSDLIRAAEEAERAGRLEDAVRLRFRAGLTALADAGRVATPRTTATAEMARALRSPGFDALARRFDEIAYGDSPPAAADVEAARREWPSVLRESGRR